MVLLIGLKSDSLLSDIDQLLSEEQPDNDLQGLFDSDGEASSGS